MAYRSTQNFAYPGWRLTVPGGPAGGHYKGFTHNYSAGTDLTPQDAYEQDREDGMSSHDAVHASPRNPRGIYRSSGEVPPRPNASGSAMTYRGSMTRRHAGTSVAPGSFPAAFDSTPEDSFIPPEGAHMGMIYLPPTVAPGRVCPTWGCNYLPARQPIIGGATSVVAQSSPIFTPQPSPTVSVSVMPPVSPTPSPVVNTQDVVPANDGSGNYVLVATGQVVPASQVQQNPATGIYQYIGGALTTAENWLTQNSIISAVPNWMLLAGVGAALFLFKGHR